MEDLICKAKCPELDNNHEKHCLSTKREIDDMDRNGKYFCPCGNEPVWKEISGGRKQREEAVEDLMEQFNKMNFKDLNRLLDWICEIQPYTNDDEIRTPSIRIADKLISKGYIENHFVGANFKVWSREQVAKWIIGQCINGLLNNGRINSLCIIHTKKWRADYNKKKR